MTTNVEIPEEDLRLEIFKNDAVNSLRLTHIPTGTYAEHSGPRHQKEGLLFNLRNTAYKVLCDSEKVINHYKKAFKTTGEVARPDLDELQDRYTPVEPPPCRVCGGELSVQRIGGNTPTIWGHSGPDGVEFSEWFDHYQNSTWTQYKSGDYEVLQLIEYVRYLETQNY